MGEEGGGGGRQSQLSISNCLTSKKRTKKLESLIGN